MRACFYTTSTDPTVRILIMQDKKLCSTNGWVCVAIGDKIVTINANPMPLVHSTILHCPITRHIGLASIVSILSPIKTKKITHMFFSSFSVAVQTICTTAYYSLYEIWKKTLTERHLLQNEPPKTGTRLRYHHVDWFQYTRQNPLWK